MATGSAVYRLETAEWRLVLQIIVRRLHTIVRNNRLANRSVDSGAELADWRLVLQIIAQKLQNESWFFRLSPRNCRMGIGSVDYADLI